MHDIYADPAPDAGANVAVVGIAFSLTFGEPAIARIHGRLRNFVRRSTSLCRRDRAGCPPHPCARVDCRDSPRCADFADLPAGTGLSGSAPAWHHGRRGDDDQIVFDRAEATSGRWLDSVSLL